MVLRHNADFNTAASYEFRAGGLFRGVGGGGGGTGGGTTSPGGSNTQIQYNNNGAFGGVPNLTWDGTTLSATGSFTGSFTGSLFGSASYATTASYALNGGVTQVLAGPNITLSPTNGLGQVTITSTGGGGGSFNTATGSYGSFFSTQTQNAGAINTPYSMSFNNTDISNGVAISGSSNALIKITNAGIYDLQFSAQLNKVGSGGGVINIWIWLRKNNIDLASTNTVVQLQGGANSKIVAAWNWFLNAAANDYYQIMWATDDTNGQLYYEAAPTNGTAVPSVIATVARVDQFLSNTGSFSGSFNGSHTGTFSGSFTGSLLGTASYATTASYVNPLNQNVIITGSLTVSGSSTFTNIGPAIFSGSATSTQGFTGSLQGTASWATNAQTASYGNITGSLFGTASWAQSASNAINAQTASFLPVNTYNITSSWAVSASQAISASRAVTSSFALTSSNIQGGSTSYIPLWNTNTSLSSSVMYQSSSNIGIGNTSPTAKLHVGTSTSFLKVTPQWQPVGAGRGTWLDISIDGPSGIGTGGPGANAWIAYVYGGGEWFTNALAGDIAYRNTSGKLLFGNTGDTAGMALYNDQLGIGTVTPSAKLEVMGNVVNGGPAYAPNLSGPFINISSLLGFTYDQADIPLGDVISSTPSSIVVRDNYSGLTQPFSCSFFIMHDGSNDLSIDPNYYSLPIITSITYDGGSNNSTFTFDPPLESTYYALTQVYPIASGSYSHAEGRGTIAMGNYQHVQGQFNQTSSAQAAFIVGNGTNVNNRSNLIFAAGSEVQITGSLSTTGSVIFKALTTSSYPWVITYDSASGQLYYTASSAIGGGGSGAGFPYSGNAVITGSLLVSGSGVTITGSLNAPSITGSLQGTASWATNALTASLAPNYVLNSATSSFVLNSQTSSFVTNSQTSSFVQNSQTSSFVTNNQTSSFVLNSQTSSFVQNSQTSSFVTNLQTSSFVLNTQTSSFSTGSFTGSFTGSLQGTASWASNATTASYITASNVIGTVTSASYAVTASYVVTALTASYITASNVIGTVLSASYALNAAGGTGGISQGKVVAIATGYSNLF